MGLVIGPSWQKRRFNGFCGYPIFTESRLDNGNLYRKMGREWTAGDHGWLSSMGRNMLLLVLKLTLFGITTIQKSKIPLK